MLGIWRGTFGGNFGGQCSGVTFGRSLVPFRDLLRARSCFSRSLVPFRDLLRAWTTYRLDKSLFTTSPQSFANRAYSFTHTKARWNSRFAAHRAFVTTCTLHPRISSYYRMRYLCRPLALLHRILPIHQPPTNRLSVFYQHCTPVSKHNRGTDTYTAESPGYCCVD